jgi:PAS domain S-box-containing protein
MRCPLTKNCKMEEKLNTGMFLNILSLEDSARDFEIICEQLNDAGYSLNIVRVEDESGFLSSLQNNRYDIILADFKLPGFDAVGALKLYREICPDVPFIVVSGAIGEETAIELIKLGAVDYVLKDRLVRLPFVIKRAISDAKEKESLRLAEAALRESEQNYRILADSGSALIRVANSVRLCSYFNSVWFEFTGRTFEQESGYGWKKGIHPDDAKHYDEISLDAFSRRDKFSVEYRLRRCDGEYRWIQDDGCPRYNSTGEFIGYISHCLDITERKQEQLEIQALNLELEQRVAQRTAQLESANKEMESFSYSISHDLRAPLRGINGFAQILLEDYASKLDDEGKKHCSRIMDSAIKMGQLIDNLLAFSRLSLADIDKSHLDMKKLIYSVFSEIADAKSQEHISLNVDELSDTYADSALIKQVWVNLLSNAVKYSSKREKGIITVSSGKENGMCIYCVKDNGVGFDMNNADKLFGVFQRLHSAKNFEGTGIGLAIVKRIVQRHGGEVWAESEVDKGATFYFSLPVITNGSI